MVRICRTPTPTPTMSAPGRRAHNAQSSRGNNHEARNQAPPERSDRQEEGEEPQPERLRADPGEQVGHAEEDGDEPDEDQGRPGLGLRVGCTLQIRRWTIHRTRTSERAVRARAKPPTTSAIRRLASDRGAGAGDRGGEQPADAGRTGGVPRILPGRRRGQPEPGDHDEGIRNQEHEEAERHCRGEHASPALGVALDGLEGGVDRGRVGPPGFDAGFRPLCPLAQMRHSLPDGLMLRRRGRRPARLRCLGEIAAIHAAFFTQPPPRARNS